MGAEAGGEQEGYNPGLIDSSGKASRQQAFPLSVHKDSPSRESVWPPSYNYGISSFVLDCPPRPTASPLPGCRVWAIALKREMPGEPTARRRARSPVSFGRTGCQGTLISLYGTYLLLIFDDNGINQNLRWAPVQVFGTLLLRHRTVMGIFAQGHRRGSAAPDALVVRGICVCMKWI